MDLPQPFVAATVAPTRHHGPGGYANYQEYKDWLRDEFVFRCVYCHERETWYPSRQGAFAVDHITPQSKRPDLAYDYDNLVYACLRCNSLKQDFETLDPSRIVMGQHLAFEPDGSIVGRTAEGLELIHLLRLDLAPAIEVRRAKLKILRLKSLYPENTEVDALFRFEFGYPEDLPDLRRKRPESNCRPDGVTACHFVRKLEGRLADVY